MPGLQELIAAMDAVSEPRVLATVLGAGEDPGPVRRVLLEAAPASAGRFAGAAREVLGGAPARILELEPGPDLDPLLATPDPVPGGRARVLLERLVPRRLPPWLHCSVQAQGRGGVTVLATVTAQDGTTPAEAGERFVYDHHNHGLLPMDGRFSLDLQRGCERARAKGTTLGAEFAFPDGHLQVVLEPLPAAATTP